MSHQLLKKLVIHLDSALNSQHIPNNHILNCGQANLRGSQLPLPTVPNKQLGKEKPQPAVGEEALIQTSRPFRRSPWPLMLFGKFDVQRGGKITWSDHSHQGVLGRPGRGATIFVRNPRRFALLSFFGRTLSTLASTSASPWPPPRLHLGFTSASTSTSTLASTLS